jgi:hypothetical protein
MEMRVHMDKKLLENINTLLDVKELGSKGSLKLHDVYSFKNSIRIESI